MIEREIQFILEHLGKPYKLGTQGPDYFDCWGWVRFINKELWNREIPWIDMSKGSISDFIKSGYEYRSQMDWVVIPNPIHSCLVEMSHARHAHHVGVFINVDGGQVVHSIQGGGVVCDPLLTIPISGWHSIKFDIPRNELNA